MNEDNALFLQDIMTKMTDEAEEKEKRLQQVEQRLAKVLSKLTNVEKELNQ